MEQEEWCKRNGAKGTKQRKEIGSGCVPFQNITTFFLTRYNIIVMSQTVNYVIYVD